MAKLYIMHFNSPQVAVFPTGHVVPNATFPDGKRRCEEHVSQDDLKAADSVEIVDSNDIEFDCYTCYKLEDMRTDFDVEDLF